MPGPSRAERTGGHHRGRLVLGILAVALIVLALSLRAIATFWTDYLWFDALDLTSVWNRLVSAKVTLGAATGLVFFALLWSNLVIADRLAPRFRSVVGPEDDLLVRYRELVAGRQRLVWLVVSVAVAIVPAVSASSQWREWLLFRFGGSFGVDDPQFGMDLELVRVPTAVLVDGRRLVVRLPHRDRRSPSAIVHYLNGAIRLQPLGERVTPNAKAHLSVLLALAAFTKAADYWLRRFELVVSGGTSFDGAGYTDVNASLPAIQLMILISLFAGVLLLVNIRRKGWTLPIIVLALWGLVAIIAGGLYPAFVQRFQVEPAELAKERPYVERNISATRTALGLDKVDHDRLRLRPGPDQGGGRGRAAEPRERPTARPDDHPADDPGAPGRARVLHVPRRRRGPLRRSRTRRPRRSSRHASSTSRACPTRRGRSCTWSSPTVTPLRWRRRTPPTTGASPSSW